MEDYQFQAPNERPALADDDDSRFQRVGLIAVAIAIAAVAVYLYFGNRSSPAQAPATAATTAPATETPRGPEAEHINLPALDDSDPLVRQRIGILSSHPLVSAWLSTSGLIRNFVVVVENMSHGTSPSRHLRVLRPPGTFRVVMRGDRFVVDPRNYDRYSSIVAAAASIDPRAAARTYATFKPLLQMAYDELGNQEPLDAAVERAIVPLLRVPAVDGDVRVDLAGEGIGYEYADPKLESLNGAQKQLLRMGAANIRTIQEQLRVFALALGIPASRLA